MTFLLTIFSIISFSSLAVTSKNTLQTKFLQLPIDHFDLTGNRTFKLRYLVYNYHHVKGGPIFLYTGNEADINLFAKNTGFLFDVAPIFNALIVFAEHRYYGQSLPFGDRSFSSIENLRYLSTSQVLKDFVYLTAELKRDVFKGMISKDTYPIVAFGGSYGGMLAAWLRMKYPHSVIGAIASSAPVLYFDDITSCEKFYEIVTDVFKKFGTEECTNTIRKSWPLIRNITQFDKGKEHLTRTWNLCKNIRTPDDVDVLLDWIADIYVNLAMSNYHYPTEFEVSLPAYPVKVFCDKLLSMKQNGSDNGLIEAFGNALEVYTNYTGKTKCNSINITSADSTKYAWQYQACVELIMPVCSVDKDMFETRPWDIKKFSEWCQRKLGVHGREPQWPVLEYGGQNFKYASNIVFSNGLMDPWSSGGVLHNVSKSVWAVNITDGAHHIDLRKADGADTNYVIAARKLHVGAIRKWLNIHE